MNTHLDRFAEIAEILSRHGLAFLASAVGLDRWLPGPPPEPSIGLGNAVRVRKALEELGPAFIKLGQLLSTRSDLLPPEYLAELSRLQDSTPSVPPAVVRGLIEQGLGAPPERFFSAFDPTPLASASIGQAHAAVLPDGTAVVVKVRRPGVVARVEEDLEILQNLAAGASRRWDAAADFNVIGIAADFAQTLRTELDYLQEGRRAERFAKNFAGDQYIHIPRIFWDTTTSRVLTMQRISGIKVDQIHELDAAGINRPQLARQATRLVAQMIFEDGFFHADPHPGNLFIEPGGRIGLIDFGMVGEVSEELRRKLAQLLRALTGADPERVSTALINLSVTRPQTNRRALVPDVARFVRLYKGRQLGEIAVSELVMQMLAILRTHHLQLPREMAMLLKMVLMTEGMGVRLDPTFNLGEALEPYARSVALSQFSPQNLLEAIGRAGLDATELALVLPTRLRSLLENLDNGVELHLRSNELEPLVARVERIGNRLVAGMITAAFIRGIGELTATDRERLRSWDKPLLGAGITAAGALGMYLAGTARRKRGLR